MKRLNLWLLMSSALMTTSHICCAQAQNIGPSNGCNGGSLNQLTGSDYTCIGDICFSNINTTNKSCFAPSSGGLTLTGNGYDICFQSVNSGNKPCAVDVTQGNVTISGFSSFLCANALNSGAICCCDTSSARTLSMSGNGTVSFLNNTASTKGGAICANTINFTSGGHTIFSGNTVSGSSGIGGAICLEGISGSSCTLSAQGGDIVFYENSATDTSAKGGAVGIKGSNGSCTLDANSGNIIFDGNTIKSNSSAVRNSVYLGQETSATHTFKAKEGFGIYFYDPVTCDVSSPTGSVKINDTGYTGSIVFSGEKLSPDEKTKSENKKTDLKHALTVQAGSLVLKDGVTVEAKQITQNDNTSTVVMDLGTTLQTPNSGGETITLQNLAINVASLGGGG
ncbi:chlamydia polymorphic membrane middle domain protein, partial [Chlamydia ibidis]